MFLSRLAEGSIPTCTCFFAQETFCVLFLNSGKKKVGGELAIGWVEAWPIKYERLELGCSQTTVIGNSNAFK